MNMDTPTRRKWLRKAKAEILCRAIQEKVDEIADAALSENKGLAGDRRRTGLPVLALFLIGNDIGH